MIGTLLVGVALAGGERATPAKRADEAYAHRVAMLVGINPYDDPLISDLQFADDDVNDLYDVFADGKYGDFDSVHPFPGRRMTKDAFWTSFRAVTGSLQEDDTFVLHFSGHGTLEIDHEAGQSRLFLLFSDSKLDDPALTGISLDELEAEIDALPARRRVLIVDACHHSSEQARGAVSEETKGLLAMFKGPPPAPNRRFPTQAVARLYASDYWRPALEDPELQNGVYTHFLVEALKGAGDTNGDELVEVREAHEWATEMTIGHTKKLQVPRADISGVGREEIFLSGNRARRIAAERWLSVFEGLPSGATLKVDGATRGPGMVEPGRYLLAVELEEGRIVRGRRRLRPGQSLDLGSFVEEQAQEWLFGLSGGWTLDPYDEATTPLSIHGQGWWMRGPLMVGGRFTAALPPVPEDRDWRAVQSARAQFGGAWGRNLKFGSSVGAGVLWRTYYDSEAVDFTPVFAGTAHARWHFSSLFLNVESGFDVVLIENDFGILPLPFIQAGVGFIL